MALRTHGEVSLPYFIVLRSNEAKQRKKLTTCHARTFATQPQSESGHSSLHLDTTHPQTLSLYIQTLSCPAMVKLHQTSPSPGILQVLGFLPIPKTTKQCQAWLSCHRCKPKLKKSIDQHAGLEGKKHHRNQASQLSSICKKDIDP